MFLALPFLLDSPEIDNNNFYQLADGKTNSNSVFKSDPTISTHRMTHHLRPRKIRITFQASSRLTDEIKHNKHVIYLLLAR